MRSCFYLLKKNVLPGVTSPVFEEVDVSSINSRLKKEKYDLKKSKYESNANQKNIYKMFYL